MLEGLENIAAEIPWRGIAIAGITAFVRGQLKSDIDYWLEAFSAYRKRPFDKDRDPNSWDRCEILNYANGKWDEVLLSYKLSLNKNQNGVWVMYVNDGYALERIPFDTWTHLRKRTCPKENKEESDRENYSK